MQHTHQDKNADRTLQTGDNTRVGSGISLPAVPVLLRKHGPEETSHVQKNTAQLQPFQLKAISPKANNNTETLPGNATQSQAFSPVIQRNITLENKYDSDAFNTAYELFMQALRQQGGKIKNYLTFVEDPRNNHNLIFKTIPPQKRYRGELHGTTNVTFSGTSEDILKHMFDGNLDPNEKIDEIMAGIDPVSVMRGIDIVIEIVVASNYNVPIYLETLNHEFTVHAIKWFDFINSVYNKGDVENTLRERIMDMPTDHKEFGRNQNEMYRTLRETIYNALEEKKAPNLNAFHLEPSLREEFMNISRGAIEGHKPHEDRTKELEILIKRAEISAQTPLLGSGFKKRKPKPADDKCCYITTACIRARGLPDDCEELTLLRRFRDNYLRNKANGDDLIGLYYQHSPLILANIQRRDDEEEILKRLYLIIRQCVDAIKNNDNEFAYKTYCAMVIRLKEEFAPELTCAIPLL